MLLVVKKFKDENEKNIFNYHLRGKGKKLGGVYEVPDDFDFIPANSEVIKSTSKIVDKSLLKELVHFFSKNKEALKDVVGDKETADLFKRVAEVLKSG